MSNIKETKRLSKRIMLANLLVNDNSIALTPLLSGRHGIGKSQVAKQIASELGGTSITIEGGTLKEGEITGIPYQYKDEKENISFKFLPYYAIDRIQKMEKEMNSAKEINILEGEENKYSRNDLTIIEKRNLLFEGKVKPLILFFDEINRTDTAVFRELMNTILTRTINGYKLPWWVFIIAAMNPSTADSMYATNEIDPAQMDRFFKIHVIEDASEWAEYAASQNYNKTLINFISKHPEYLVEENSSLRDDEQPSPSPRGWSMINLVIESGRYLDCLFTDEETAKKNVDLRTIIYAKVGAAAGASFIASLNEPNPIVLANDIFAGEEYKPKEEILKIIKKQNTIRNSITSASIIGWLKKEYTLYKEDNKVKNYLIETLKIYINTIDESSKYLFARKLINEQINRSDSLANHFATAIDLSIIESLTKTNQNAVSIKGDA